MGTTEIARELFVTLQRVGERSPYGNKYLILNDLNYMTDFFAESDNKAKEMFKAYLDK